MTTQSNAVLAAACTPCSALFGGGREYAPGRHMAVVHGEHVPELQARGWIVLGYLDEPADVVCPHYAALCGDDE
jgi:hypothetical protein